MNASDKIRAMASRWTVFGAEELREAHGNDVALLATRLAAKGEFTRIRNGVFAPPGVGEDHPAYAAYIDRRRDEIVRRAGLPEATIADRFFAWAMKHGPFRVGDATAEFGRDMKDFVSSYHRRGKIDRPSEGVYSYDGPRPAARRTAIPAAASDAPAVALVRAAFAGTVLTAADIVARTGLEPNVVRAALARLVTDEEILQEDASSTNSHRNYRSTTVATGIEDEDAIAVLAIIATAGAATTRTVAAHKLPDTPRLIQRLLAGGLVERAGRDETLGGTCYRPTHAAADLLTTAGRGWRDTLPEAHRPFERAILRAVIAQPGTSLRGILAAMPAEYPIRRIEKVCLRMVGNGLLTSSGGKPLALTATALATASFAP